MSLARHRRRPRVLVSVLSLGAATASLTCVETRALPPCDASSALPPPRDPRAAVVVAAGDLARCPGGKHHETAAVAASLEPDAVLTLGDTAYPNGSLDEFLDCYDPAWGRFRAITRAAVGNHEYHAPHAGPFFAYFCGSTGTPFEGWTSFDIGAWHVVVLNSNCGGDLDVPPSVPDEMGGCGATSRQTQWLDRDLAAHPRPCTLATWHHPRFTSGPHADATFMRDTWAVLARHGVDVVLSGHDHNYERFAPMDADGNLDATRGLRQFVVGTGGTTLADFSTTHAGSEARQAKEHGVLRLELRERSYRWRFVPVAGGSTHDEGEAPCHD